MTLAAAVSGAKANHGEGIIESARRKLESYDLKELHREGLSKNRFMGWKDSQIVVTYPPKRLLPEIDPETIFAGGNGGDYTLYFHIPFCTGRCLYCGFATYANRPKSIGDRYVEALKSEIRIARDFDSVSEAKVKSLYMGGGTPTYLSTEQLGNLLEAINDNFDIRKGTEFTVESSPETLSEEKLNCLLDSGVNRLSIGVQTFNDEILKLLLRRHDSEQAVSSFYLARDAGFDNINIDIIRALPDMTPEKLMDDLETIEMLMPESVSGYHLVIKPKALIKNLYMRERHRFPDEEGTMLMHLMLVQRLKSLGYRQNPIDWFYQGSHVYEQQIQKWEDMINSLSFGPSAYSYVNNVQYYNEPDLNDYIRAVNGGELPVKGGQRLSDYERIHRKFVFGMKTHLDKELFRAQFGGIPGRIRRRLDRYEELGLIQEDDRHIRLTEKGMLIADEICTKFYSPRIAGELSSSWFQAPRPLS